MLLVFWILVRRISSIVNRLEVCIKENIGSTGYSLDLDSLHNTVDSSSDVMIQFGDIDVYSETLLGLTKNGSSFSLPCQQKQVMEHIDC